MTYRRVMVALLLMALPSLALAEQDRATMVRQEEALLVFLGGGSPLSASEQAAAAAMVDRALSTAPALWRERSGRAAALWADLQRGDIRARWRMRATLRLRVQGAPPANDPLGFMAQGEAAIIKAHDPAVVWDAPSGQLITRTAVARMVEAERAAAPVLGLPAPPDDAEALLEHALSAGWTKFDARMRTWLANAEANLPDALPFLNNGTGATRERVIGGLRRQVLEGSGPEDRVLREAQVLAGAGANGAARGTGGRGAGGSVAGLQLRQNLVGNALLGASRSYSPSCNVYTGTAQANRAFCMPH